MPNTVHIAIAYQDPLIDPSVVENFEDDIASPELKVKVESVPFVQFRAGIEWLFPTAVVAYLAKPYFESFLKEMGKDHYLLTKRALKNVHTRIREKYSDRIKLSSKGKLRDEGRSFSPIFSIEAESPFEYRFKLLIQTDISDEIFEEALGAFLDLLAQSHHLDAVDSNNQKALVAKPMSSIVLVSYNQDTGMLETEDPVPKRGKP